jgi:hypothetical protein
MTNAAYAALKSSLPPCADSSGAGDVIEPP